jgi:histidinol-phosphatase
MMGIDSSETCDMNADWRNRYQLAIDAARRAGDHARQYFDRGVSVDWKADSSPVTIADREAEAMLRSTLLAAFPNDGFLGEESGEQAGDSGYRWVIDPVDGTKSFIRNIPLWATLIGLEYKGEQIAGVAYLPVMGGTTYRALRGDGAWRDDRRIRVSDIDRLEDSTMFYSSLSWFAKAGREREFLRLVTLTQRQRGFGDFYGFILVAQGSGEMMAEHGVKPWDVAALKAIVEEAGGKCTNWANENTIYSPDILASNGKLHDVTLGILNGK